MMQTNNARSATLRFSKEEEIKFKVNQTLGHKEEDAVKSLRFRSLCLRCTRCLLLQSTAHPAEKPKVNVVISHSPAVFHLPHPATNQSEKMFDSLLQLVFLL